MFRIATASRRTVLVASAAALGLALSGAAPAVSAVARPAAPAAGGRYTAKEIHTFLEYFYGGHGPGAFARKYGVTKELAKKAGRTHGYDLLLCAQNTPRSIDIGRVTTAQSAGVGWATVTTHWRSGSARHFTAYVDLDAHRPIQLLDVHCRA